ncbi:hypothetical protein [Halalkalibacter flavus]|uniref:hypothetical protein n=1 Tax=Halalkalibacter flavus TaxID=3090668 RepID=UPI002FCBE417
MKLRKIRLDDIILEGNFFEDEMDLPSTKPHDQTPPLVVEGPTADNKYYLVDGMIHYYNLTNHKKTHTLCLVMKETNKLERVITRLKNELNKIRKNHNKISDLINYLRTHNYSVLDIAQECQRHKATIYRYLKKPKEDITIKNISDTNKENYKKLNDLINSATLKDSVKEETINKILNSEFMDTHIETIKEFHDISEFEHLSAESQLACINKTFNQTKFIEQKTFVYEEALKQRFNKTAHEHLYNVMLKSLKWITENCHSKFSKYLDLHQKMELQEQLSKISDQIHEPVKIKKSPHRPRSTRYQNKLVVSIETKVKGHQEEKEPHY